MTQQSSKRQTIRKTEVNHKWKVSVKMSETNYDQSGSNSDEVSELFLANDRSKSKPYLFKPLAPLKDEIEENEACNICRNQAPSSS